MHRGDVVESGDARAVLDNPQHDYSRALGGAVLPPDPILARQIIEARMARAAAVG
jgi:peptide/nickel transport system ATP-binding protein